MVISITDVAEKFGGLPHYCLMEKIGHFTFYGGQYINLVKTDVRLKSYVQLCHQQAKF